MYPWLQIFKFEFNCNLKSYCVFSLTGIALKFQWALLLISSFFTNIIGASPLLGWKNPCVDNQFTVFTPDQRVEKKSDIWKDGGVFLEKLYLDLTETSRTAEDTLHQVIENI